jgi:hypothetical protein
MKFAPLTLALGAVLLFTSCAGVHVTETQTAAVVTSLPKAIYIRPFDVSTAEFRGAHAGGRGERPIRQSLAPIEFSEALKEELEKLAPARILQEDEVAPLGWLVEGTIDKVHAGSPVGRAVGVPMMNPIGRSRIRVHVRIIDLDHASTLVEAKGGGAKEGGTLARHGRVIYEFDVAGGSKINGAYGSITAPGLGYATPFDYRNAAERIRTAINPDPHRYGLRTSPTIR